MPTKLPRCSATANQVQNYTVSLEGVEPETALWLGGAWVAHGAITTTGQIASDAIGAVEGVLNTVTITIGECFTSFMGYLKECEITARVMAQERQHTARVLAQEQGATARMEAWSAAVIADAQARTEEVKLQTTRLLAVVRERTERREAKLLVIQNFMNAYASWNKMLTTALASWAGLMPLHERERLQNHIDILLQRTQSIERAVAAIAVAL